MQSPIASRPPVSLTSLVGRDRELKDLDALVRARRLVTLTGVGGAGKTRLAAELALRIDWTNADSAAWVDLATCCDPKLVLHQVAAAFSLRSDTFVDALVEALRDRELWMVIDNCEHLVAPVAEVVRTLLVRCPGLHIIATSREPLGIDGEHVWSVPTIAADEAVQLFIERATAADAEIKLDNRAVIDEICRRLDFIPLAIELAAARIRVLTPEQIAEKLEDRFSLLTISARATTSRHRTLRAAIDWSFDLLSPAERSLLAKLSVFAGTFSLEDAVAVCDADLDLLTGLVEKSLVATHRRRGTVRYHFLETIRQYALERLDAAGDVRRRHATSFLAMARDTQLDPVNSGPPERLIALDLEYDNVRAALAWSIDHEPDEIALPLAVAFRWYWYYRIRWSEGLHWMTRVLDRSSNATSPFRAAVLAAAGTFSFYLGDLDAARRRLEEAVSMWRDLGDLRELGLTLSPLAQTLASAGELDDATACAEESVGLVRRSGSKHEVALCLANGYAFVAQRRGDFDEADRALEEAEAIWSPTRTQLGLPFVLNARALLAVRRGDHAAATRLARAALIETRMSNDLWFSARALRILAFTSTHDLARAARLLAASDTMLRTIGARMLLHEKTEHDRLMSTLREKLKPADLDAALQSGAGMKFEEACELALEEEAAESGELHVRDLGPLRIALDGESIDISARQSKRTREMLAFLIAHPGGVTKEEAGLEFWPDATTEQVKNSFHVTLHRLRKLLGRPDAVAADSGRYTIGIPHTADSQRFEKELTAALRNKTSDVATLERALSLYGGDFLQGEETGEWALAIRSRLKQLYVRGLFALAQQHEARGHLAEAAEAYGRLLAVDPLHESATRQLMICRARLGARSESLQIYRQFEERLRDELQSSPERETASLYQRLRQNEAV